MKGYSLNELRHVVDDSPVVRHAFLKTFRDGRLNREQVRFWAVQQKFFSSSLPDCFAVLYGRFPYHLWKEKRVLFELLNIEVWGSTVEGCHSKLFLEFSDFLGIDVSQLGQNDERPYTKEYIAKRFDLCANLSRPLTQGFSAIAVGNELVNLEIFAAYREGIQKIPGFEECPTGYFDAHLSDEESDFKVFDDLYQMIACDNSLAEAKTGLIEILGARCIFLDALLEDILKI